MHHTMLYMSYATGTGHTMLGGRIALSTQTGVCPLVALYCLSHWYNDCPLHTVCSLASIKDTHHARSIWIALDVILWRATSLLSKILVLGPIGILIKMIFYIF